MQHRDDQLLFSPSDLGSFLECEHLTQLELAVALREGRPPSYENSYAELLRRKGQEHEQAYLATLRDAGRAVVEVRLDTARDFEAGTRRTAEAMRAGADYIYQAVFFANGWRGIADFLERVERPSVLGAWSYQVLDTKLARHPRPEHALQLSFYSQAVEQIQQLAPDLAYVVLGTRERVPIRLADVTAYFRRVRERFGGAVAARPETGPYPCHHCSFCDFRISSMPGSSGIPTCTSTTSAARSRARSSGSWPSTSRARRRWTICSGARSSWISTRSSAGP